MSRARSLIIDGQEIWFDTKVNGRRASIAQMELLADAEGLSDDDLLDEDLTQGEALLRLREALGQGVVPPYVMERRRMRRAESQHSAACRICSAYGWECEGRMTRHHFVPRWLMRELQNYEDYAARSKCTIPICFGRHRDLHTRGVGDKSIVPYLTEDEKRFAHRMLDELREEHPKIFDLLAGGQESESYEACLIRDYLLANSFAA